MKMFQLHQFSNGQTAVEVRSSLSEVGKKAQGRRLEGRGVEVGVAGSSRGRGCAIEVTQVRFETLRLSRGRGRGRAEGKRLEGGGCRWIRSGVWNWKDRRKLG
ncbi:hypothetical protein CRG98_028246 [Punica granatum]|uniref:Uncharacterized protein n=1 Tax=Punica granatum TaxID=22663 RepID=A0A2I0J570_PUNGR|nr:hypothetical protein CRG98_028246 [Punica granatum]